jgi:hypothetical protein
MERSPAWGGGQRNWCWGETALSPDCQSWKVGCSGAEIFTSACARLRGTKGELCRKQTLVTQQTFTASQRHVKTEDGAKAEGAPFFFFFFFSHSSSNPAEEKQVLFSLLIAGENGRFRSHENCPILLPFMYYYSV